MVMVLILQVKKSQSILGNYKAKKKTQKFLSSLKTGDVIIVILIGILNGKIILKRQKKSYQP